MATAPNTILLRVISNTNGTFEFAVELDGTIGETRALLEAQLLGEGDPRRIKMTFRGVVLEKDDALWSLYSPKPRESMYAVVLASKTVAPAVIAPGMASAAGLGGGALGMGGGNATSEQAKLMEPMIDSMVSNPGFVDMIIAMSPELKGLVEQQPELKQQLQNPELMKRMLRAQYDPLERRAMDQSINSQMAQLNNIPGGMAMLERVMGNALNEERYGPKDAADKKMASEEHARPIAGQSANTLEAPNPWARPQPQPQQQAGHMGMGRGGMGMPVPMPGMYGRGGMVNPFGVPMFPMGGMFPPTPAGNPASAYRPPSGATPAPVPAQPVSAQPHPALSVADYSAQIAILKDMGFEDEGQITRALAASKGDIDGAVAFIDAEQG